MYLCEQITTLWLSDMKISQEKEILSLKKKKKL